MGGDVLLRSKPPMIFWASCSQSNRREARKKITFHVPVKNWPEKKIDFLNGLSIVNT